MNETIRININIDDRAIRDLNNVVSNLDTTIRNLQNSIATLNTELSSSSSAWSVAGAA